MGVRHLKTFMEQEVRSGSYPISMDNEIRTAYKGDSKPLIVIDLMALFGLFCDNKLSLLCGSQVTLAERRAADFFSRLTATGAELVFFYDGSLQPTKYKTWTNRQNIKYHNMIAIIEAIDRGKPLRQVAKQFDRTIPNNTLLKLKRIAKRHGKTIISTHVECDQALAAYAIEHKALAIISHDTDFLIYQGYWRLWSADHIIQETLETVEYNRKALLRTLGLQWHQMALWATLAGNDFFKYDEVEQFHRCLGHFRQKFYNLAEYVRSLPSGRKLTNNTINIVLQRVYSGRTIPHEAIEWFKQSLTFYKTGQAYVNETGIMDPVKSFLLNADQQFVFNIMKGNPINSTIFFFDYRSSAFGSYFDIVAPIIARIAGVILFHNRRGAGRDEEQDVILLAKRTHLESYAQHTVSAEFPTVAPPDIMELLSSVHSQDLIPRKLQLLAWVCCDKVASEPFAAVPSPLMLTVLALCRLRECDALFVFEADLLLRIAYDLSTGGFDPAQERQPFRLDPRAFRIGFLFQKVYAQCARAAKSCGLPSGFRPSTPYDGLRFHNQYPAWRDDGQMQQYILPIADWRLYSKTP